MNVDQEIANQIVNLYYELVIVGGSGCASEVGEVSDNEVVVRHQSGIAVRFLKSQITARREDIQALLDKVERDGAGAMELLTLHRERLTTMAVAAGLMVSETTVAVGTETEVAV